MKKNPLLFTSGLAFAASLLGAVIIHLLASSSSSFSQHWTTAVGMIVVGSVLAGYWIADNRRPPLPGMRLRYTALASLFGGFASALNFVVASRAWGKGDPVLQTSGFFYQLTHPWAFGQLGETTRYGTSHGLSWTGMMGVGVFAGGFACFVAFRNFDTPDV